MGWGEKMIEYSIVLLLVSLGFFGVSIYQYYKNYKLALELQVVKSLEFNSRISSLEDTVRVRYFDPNSFATLTNELSRRVSGMDSRIAITEQDIRVLNNNTAGMNIQISNLEVRMDHPVILKPVKKKKGKK